MLQLSSMIASICFFLKGLSQRPSTYWSNWLILTTPRLTLWIRSTTLYWPYALISSKQISVPLMSSRRSSTNWVSPRLVIHRFNRCLLRTIWRKPIKCSQFTMMNSRAWHRHTQRSILWTWPYKMRTSKLEMEELLTSNGEFYINSVARTWTKYSSPDSR